MTITSKFVTNHHSEDWLSFFHPIPPDIYLCIRFPWAFSFPDWTVPAFSASSPNWDALLPICWAHSSKSMPFLNWEYEWQVFWAGTERPSEMDTCFEVSGLRLLRKPEDKRSEPGCGQSKEADKLSQPYNPRSSRREAIKSFVTNILLTSSNLVVLFTSGERLGQGSCSMFN